MRLAKGDKVLRPVHPNVGIEAEYRRKVRALVDEMAASYEHWIKAQYRATPPRLAMDATPAKELERELSMLGKRWQKKIDAAAPKLGDWFAQRASRRSSLALKKILADGGLTVNLTITPTMRDAYQAVVAENVGLIKSIGQQYHSQVQGLVMRSVAAGHDLGTLTKELRARYGVSYRRAALIARDQNRKATSVFVRVRQKELGLTAIWLHSHGGKEPRPTHFKNSGKTYDPAKGWFDPDPKVKRFIWPGELINCRCVSTSVVKGFS
jgi:uncharacterized protein with gpF-like domain